MDATALVAAADGGVTHRQVSLPDPGPDEIVVETAYSGISIGTERNLLTGRVSWGPFPICPGYQAVGRVTAAGADVDEFAVGDDVYYRANAAPTLPDGTAVSATSGTHCSHAVLDPTAHGVGPLPEAVSHHVASTFVMPAVGLNGVDRANVRLGDAVVVHGTGLIGLGVVAACTHRGADVIAVDLRDDRLRVARTFGATHTINAAEEDVPSVVEELTGDGADVVFEATGIPDCIDPAMTLCRTEGTFVFQGDYGRNPISFEFGTPHEAHLNAVFPCNDGLEPGRRAVLHNIATGAIGWEETITDVLSADEAPAFYDRVLDRDLDGVIGAVIEWTPEPKG